MGKKLVNFLINVAVMYIIIDFLPDFKAPYQGVSKLYAGILFALMLIISQTVRSLVGLPKLLFVNLFLGSLLTFGIFWLVNNFSTNVFSFASTYIGGGNFIFFAVPRAFAIQDVNLVILFTAIIANICSIIIFRLKKR